MKGQQGAASEPVTDNDWVDEEISGAALPDARLKARLGKVLKQLSQNVSGSIPTALENWADIKGAYRLLSNERVDDQAIASGHFEATRRRVKASQGPVLVLHDTTTFTFERLYPEDLGFVNQLRQRHAPEEMSRVCGLLMHASLAVSQDAVPLGLCALKFWSRAGFDKKAKAGDAKESQRWIDGLEQAMALLDDPARCVHIADRESDIHELFCAAETQGTYFLVRANVDRLTGDGAQSIEDEMLETPIKGMHRVHFRDRWGHEHTAKMTLRYRRLQVRPPKQNKKGLPVLSLTVLHAEEKQAPLNRAPLCWKLITNLPIESREQAVEKLEWYAMRWHVETFFKTLKTGCKAEDTQLRTAQRVSNLMALYCVLAWRQMWVTLIQRVEPEAAIDTVFSEPEIEALNALVPTHWKNKVPMPKTVHDGVMLVARLGGYLARNHDRPPGSQVIWRGMRRLNDIVLGMSMR